SQVSGCGQMFLSSHGVPGEAYPVGVQTLLLQTAAEAQVVPAEHFVPSARASPAQYMLPLPSCWQRSNCVHGLPSLHPHELGWLGSEGLHPVEVLVRAT